MPRLRQVARADADPLALQMYDLLFGDRDPVAEPGTDTGTPGNWWTVFALVPDCLKHAVQGFQFYRDPARQLDPQLRELGQTRAGYNRGSQFVFSQHCKSCRSVGMSEEKIAAIPHWAVSDVFSDLERAVLAYTDGLVLLLLLVMLFLLLRLLFFYFVCYSFSSFISLYFVFVSALL